MTIRSIIELVVLAALWGASFLFMRIAVPEFGAVALVAARVLIAGLVLALIWRINEPAAQRVQLSTRWRQLLFVGILNSAIPFVLFAYSTLYITGGVAAILNGTAPIWGAAVAWVWLGDRLSLSGIFGLVIGLFGVAILVSDELLIASQGKAYAIAAAAFAPFLYGIAANFTAQKLNDVSPLSIATFSQLSASACLLPLLFWFAPATMPGLEAWLALLALAVLCTSLAYLLFFRLLSQIGSTRTISVTFMIPLFGSLWGAVFIDEPISLMMVIGMGVILLGTALVTGVLKPPIGTKHPAP